MRKLSLFILVLLARATCWASAIGGHANYIFFYGGQIVGTGSMQIKITAGGGRYVRIALHMPKAVDGIPAFSSSDEEWTNAHGAVVRESEEGRDASGRITMRRFASISHGTAVLDVIRGMTHTHITLAAPAGSVFNNPSVFWFLTTKPPLDAKVDFETFSVALGAWVDGETSYLGDDSQGHRMIARVGKLTLHVVVDSSGVPILYQKLGSFKLLRKREQKKQVP